jgi:hypothetical protein
MTYCAGKNIKFETTLGGVVNDTGEEGSICFGERGSIIPFFPIILDFNKILWQ